MNVKESIRPFFTAHYATLTLNTFAMKRLTLTMSIMLFFIATIAVACEPPTKNAYLENFKEFVDKIGETHKDMSNSDWEKAKEHYDKFTGEWYKKFKDDFTRNEKDLIHEYKLKFNYYHTLHKVGNTIDTLISSECTKEVVGELEQELQSLESTLEAAGGAAEELSKELGKELEVALDKFSEHTGKFIEEVQKATEEYIEAIK